MAHEYNIEECVIINTTQIQEVLTKALNIIENKYMDIDVELDDIYELLDNLPQCISIIEKLWSDKNEAISAFIKDKGDK